MKINATRGGSQKDTEAIHFSYWTFGGLGHERTIAIYLPSTNTLDLNTGCSKFLDKIIKALTSYGMKHHDIPLYFPIKVEYY